MPNPRECQICWFVSPSLTFRVCNLCNNKYHEVCYFESRPKQQDHCQACRHVMDQKQGKKPKMEPLCIVCNNNEGLMKQMSENKFVHILCALTSKNFEIQTYEKFNVKIANELKIHKCRQCKKQSPHLIQCQLCQFKAHKECLTSDQQYVGMNLQGNLQNLNFLLDLLDQQDYKSETLELIKKLKPNWIGQSKSYIKSAICSSQFKKYCWCFCAKPELNDEDYNPSILCDGCNRYVHLDCTGMKDPNQIKSYFCPGCKSKQKYNAYAKFSSLIAQIIKLETINLTIPDIRTIDSFPFILSKRLIANIKKQHSKVIDYLAIKIINEVCSKKIQKSQNQSFFDLVKLVTCQKKSSKSQAEIWNSYCLLLKQIDPESAEFIYSLKSIEAQKLQKERRSVEVITNIKDILETINTFLKRGVLAQITLITRKMCKIRQLIRQSNQVRSLVENHLNKSLFCAFLLFKTSSANQQKIIQTLMCHYFQGRTMAMEDLEQLRVTKKRGCPNFQTETAWQILESQIQIKEQQNKFNKNFQTNEERKVSSGRRIDQIQNILAKVLQNRQTNPKIYGPLKKRTSECQVFGQMDRKLAVCYQWSVLSKKVYFGIEKKKMSISGILQARRQMKKCKYPSNKLSQQLQTLYEFCKPILKLLKRIRAYKAKEEPSSFDLESFFEKPSVGELEYALRLIKDSKHPQIWADLELLEIQCQLEKVEIPRKKLAIFLKHLNPCQPTSPVSVQGQTKIQKLTSSQLVWLRKQIQESIVNMVNIEQYYQVIGQATLAQVIQKNAKWIAQKESQIQNEQQLKSDLLDVLAKMKEDQQFQNYCLQDLLISAEMEDFFVGEFKKMGDVKFNYFTRHLKRNKKWAQDLKNLEKGLIKSINYQQICCLQTKLKSSIFNHQHLLQQIITPNKTECIKVSAQIREHIPYCKVLLHNISLKQNIYNPQNKLYKAVKQLKIKDYPLRLYEKDCDTLRSLTSLQQKMNKKTYQDYQFMLAQFQQIYFDISIFLHEVKVVWDLVFKISQKLIHLYREFRGTVSKEAMRNYLNRHKKLAKLTKSIVQFGEVPQVMNKMEELDSLLNNQWQAFNYGLDGY